jgi:LacI family transcriptional regulator
MALTLEDIARLSGVSRSTVSRVINGDANVKDETRKKVMEVVGWHNFQPNLAARGLAMGHTNVIGLVIPMGVSTLFTNPYFSQLIQGVSTACNVLDHSIMFWLAEPEYERRMVRQIIGNGMVDGVVVSATLIDDPIVVSLHESRMPFVLIGHHPSLDLNSVDLDNVQGARLATSHLLGAGRKRVATISGSQNTMAGRDRSYGYRLALKEKDIIFDPALVVDGNFTEQGGYLAMQKLLPAHPDGVFAASDLTAAGAMRAILEAGLRVPEDIAIVGFDDLPVATQLEPSLTTIHQPIQRMGTLAVETLINIIHEPQSPPHRIVIEPELILRESCGVLNGTISMSSTENKDIL